MNAQQLEAAITQLYPKAAQFINFKLIEQNGVGSIAEWNEAAIGAPLPSSFNLARGWFLFSQRNANGRMASGMIDAMRTLVPELSAAEGAQQRPEGYVVVLLLEGMANNNPTRINAVKAERVKWGQKRAQVDAVTLSASPTESEYLTKADTLNAITY